MIGIVLITHHELGRVLLQTAEGILGELENCTALSVDGSSSMDQAMKEIQERIRSMDQGEGVLVLTDMFGGTPSNMSLSLLESTQLEVVTGANLPMLLKILNRREADLEELAGEAKSAGRQGIVVAGEVMKRKISNG
ncbi:MAG: PTS sugar transporter subunit IIA [Desulfohalobiaceae bacterium]|nr:PTS sugar transporter subunit IIA [Desulfohalobiaceae bacterium]